MKISRLLCAVIVLILAIHETDACTTFCLKNGTHLTLGKSLDFYTGVGFIVINKRNLVKQAYPMPDANPVSWVSRYGSITFNQFGKEFPYGGMNEKGLVIESMWLPETLYPDVDSRQGLFELQWIQYQLDNSASVEDVLASDAIVRISRLSAPIHFLVADRKGNIATVEFIDGKTIIHTGEQLPHCALANSPYQASSAFVESIADPQSYAKSASTKSYDRFTKAAVMAKNFSGGSAVEYAFSILEGVKQGSFTRWNIVYDIHNRRVFYKTQNNPVARTLTLADVDLSCGSSSLYRNIDDDLNGKADLLIYTVDVNRQTVNTAFDAIAGRPEFINMMLPPEERELLVLYPESMTCKPE